MGDFNSINYQGYEFDDNYNQNIYMQWHLTVECDQRCKHCYMFESDNYELQRKNQLSTDEAYQLLDEFAELAKKLKTYGYINLTGGDPILSKNFWEVLEYARKHKEYIAIETIMGNPYHIDEKIASRLKECGIKNYQISLDGLEKTHDEIRKKGSFAESLRALQCLHSAGIRTAVMATVHKHNSSEILELYKYLRNLEYVDSFTFDRMIPIGNGRNQYGDNGIVDKYIYRNLLLSVFEYENFEKGPRKLVYKDKLWRVLFYELGLVDPIDDNNKKFCGTCSAGSGIFTVLADGEIYSCRRLDLSAGKFPENTIEETYLNSNLFKRLRGISKESKCSKCKLFYYCYGCPAMKFAVNGDLDSVDPTCWRAE